MIAKRPTDLDLLVSVAPTAAIVAAALVCGLGPLKILPEVLGGTLFYASFCIVPVSALSLPIAGFRLLTGKWDGVSRAVLGGIFGMGLIGTVLLVHLLVRLLTLRFPVAD